MRGCLRIKECDLTKEAAERVIIYHIECEPIFGEKLLIQCIYANSVVIVYKSRKMAGFLNCI